MAAPTTPQPIPNRACERQLSGPFSPLAQGSMAEFGTRQSESARLEVIDTRIDILPCKSDAVNPGVPLSITKPRMPSSARAQTIATSAAEPLVIQVFSPFRIQ